MLTIAFTQTSKAIAFECGMGRSSEALRLAMQNSASQGIKPFGGRWTFMAAKAYPNS
jgi:hypothetical protein